LVEIDTDEFSEAGGAAALRGDAASESTAFSTLGLRASVPVGALSLNGSIGWRHDFDSGPSTSNLALLTGSGTRFTVTGAPTSGYALTLEAGAEIKLGGNARFGLKYLGELGDRSDGHGARAALIVSF